MGYIQSTGGTVESHAYLTETGRNYLFNKTNNRFDNVGDDLFEIVKFALSDSDNNYVFSKSESSPDRLSFGQVPDITGEGDGGCLKTTANYIQRNLIAYVFDDTPTNVSYSTDASGNVLSILEASIPTTSETPPAIGAGTNVGATILNPPATVILKP